MSLIKKFKKRYREILRGRINKDNIARLNNKTPSIISNNCNGGVISHDLNLKFLSPTVNLFMSSADYLIFLSNLEFFLALNKNDMSEIEDSTFDYPVAKLGCENTQIILHFVHYPTYEDAKNKWFERAKRVDMENLYVMATERDGCSENEIREFNALKYKHKIMFVSSDKYDLPNVRYVSFFVDGDCVGVLSEYVSRWSGKRIIDKWDYVSFLNEK